MARKIYRKFGYAGVPRTCRWCGTKLARFEWADEPWAKGRNLEYGFDGHGAFCTHTCGYLMGLWCAQTGNARAPASLSPNKE